MLTVTEITGWFSDLQNRICIALEQLDGKAKFEEDTWTRKGGGGGRTRIIQNGSLFERGGVNFSHVFGIAPLQLKKSMGWEADEEIKFLASGMSIVIHPNNPWVPIIHMNVRYFELGDSISWFGGGIDVTPHYVIDADAKFFHTALKKLCDQHDPGYYPDFKKQADDYFFIKHREETRGIGGIFFDQLKPSTKKSGAELFSFVQSVGESFIPIYSELTNRNRNKPFGEAEKNWQFLRRGRYVEFNLVYDRGTRFGLETDGRTESILMSLPPQANWMYNFMPEPGSREEDTLSKLKKGIGWITIDLPGNNVF